MAVKEANSIYKSFTFNGVSAADYGVYVTDVNVFNSAERAVEYITIPGRNGSFALDHGRFENITVEYECALGQDTDVDFATAISDFRNALAAAKGYQRLEDDMNPDEYRMAVFSKGLEAPTLNQQTATFKVEFNCKPQRYLKSGETAVIVSSRGTITNPTLFDARPLLQVWGYGDIGINDDTITIDDAVIGSVLLSNGANGISVPLTFSEANLRAGDSITLRQSYIRVLAYFGNGARLSTVTVSVGTDADSIIYVCNEAKPHGSDTAQFDVFFNELAFASGTALSHAATLTVSVLYTPSGSSEPTTKTFTWDVSVAYTAGKITMDASPRTSGGYRPNYNNLYTYGAVNAYSTKSALGEPLYFDLDIGEAYKEEDGAIVSVNNAVSFPVQLPVLKPGANTITLENTVDQFKLVPRWWKV